MINMLNKRKIKKHIKMNTFDWINYAFFALIAIIMIFPFWYVLVGSFSDGLDYMAGGVWLWPRKWSLVNFKMILNDSRLLIAYRNTILRVIIGTTTQVLFTSFVAYAMSRSDLPGKKVFRIINIFTLFFSGGFIPYYLIITSLGLYDSFLVYILPSLYSASNMIILCAFFKDIPNELHEAAIMDGASEIKIWWTIYMPLSKPIIATVALWITVGHWNAYFNTMVFTRNPQLITLQYYLLKVIKESSMPSGDFLTAAELEQVNSTTVSYAAIIIATLPIIFVYPYVSRYFLNDLKEGGIKG